MKHLLGSLALGWAACAAAAPKPGLWELTTTMNIPGMPALPRGAPAGLGPAAAQTHRQCLTPVESTPQAAGLGGNCRRDSVHANGNSVHYTITCDSPKGPMHGEGTATYTGDTMSSTVNMSGQREGHPFAMSMTTTGHYLGPSCDAK